MKRLAWLLLSPMLACQGPTVAPNAPANLPSEGATSTVPAPAAADLPLPAPDPHFDPMDTGMTEDGVSALCEDQLGKATKVLVEIKSLKGRPANELTYDATLGRFDDVLNALYLGESLPYLMAVAHPNPRVRSAAKKCEPNATRFTTSMWLDADLAGVIKAYASRRAPDSAERKKFLSEVLRDFRRNGLDLAPEKQARLRALNDEITKLGQEFTSAIGASRQAIEVSPAALAGLPEEYKRNHPATPKGTVLISTDYPDYFPFLTYSKDRKSALELYIKFVNRGGITNVRFLETLLALRREKAELLGYATWADYAIEPGMAKDAKTVKAFLDRMRDALKEPAEAEFKEFQKEHQSLTGEGAQTLLPPDRYFLEDRIRAKKYKYDSKELSKYLEVGAVRQGLMDITAKMYDIEYRRIDEEAWHPDVLTYEVLSAGNRIGKFYFDLHPRNDKYKHAAMFTIRSGKRMRDGSYQTPIAALVCNFPKPGSEPALMSHDDVVTFFHEFGHVLHELLTESEISYFSGTSTARDFVEAPSQMFEEWPWSREVLDMFAKHHQTGAKIPDKLFDALTQARQFGRALSTQRQLFLATLDFEYHFRKPGFDTVQALKEIQNASSRFRYVKGTHFQSSFGHLINYDARYYGYQWALSLSRDILTRFQKEGLMNHDTARSYRQELLSQGASRNETASVTAFLGRPPDERAYIQFLKGGQ